MPQQSPFANEYGWTLKDPSGATIRVIYGQGLKGEPGANVSQELLDLLAAMEAAADRAEAAAFPMPLSLYSFMTNANGYTYTPDQPASVHAGQILQTTKEAFGLQIVDKDLPVEEYDIRNDGGIKAIWYGLWRGGTPYDSTNEEEIWTGTFAGLKKNGSHRSWVFRPEVNMLGRDVEGAAILSGDNATAPNLISFEIKDSRIEGNGSTKTWTMNWKVPDGVFDRVDVYLEQPSGGRFEITAFCNLGQDGSGKLIVTYPTSGNNVNDGPDGAQGSNGALQHEQFIVVRDTYPDEIFNETASNSVIAGGQDNIIARDIGNGIFAGTGNRIGEGGHSVVLGGHRNSLNYGSGSAILAGRYNRIGSGSKMNHYGAIIGGVANSIQTEYGGMVLGTTCEVRGDWSFAGGQECHVFGYDSFAYGMDLEINGNYSQALGKASNVDGDLSMAIGYAHAVGHDYSLAVGNGAIVRAPYSLSLGGGRNADGGIVQSHQIIGRGMTVDEAWLNIMDLYVPAGVAWAYEAVIIGNRTDSPQACAFKVTGCADRGVTDDNLRMLPANGVTTVMGGDASVSSVWTAGAVESGANPYHVIIRVKGEAGQNVSWGCTLNITEMTT